MRREFPDKVRIAAFERAKGHCEKCTARLVVGKFAYDHVIADALGGEPEKESVDAARDGTNPSSDLHPTSSDVERIEEVIARSHARTDMIPWNIEEWDEDDLQREIDTRWREWLDQAREHIAALKAAGYGIALLSLSSAATDLAGLDAGVDHMRAAAGGGALDALEKAAELCDAKAAEEEAIIMSYPSNVRGTGEAIAAKYTAINLAKAIRSLKQEGGR